MKIDIILMAVFFAYAWVYRLGLWPKLHLTFKPFNCETCLSFWTVVAVGYWEAWPFHLILLNAIAAYAIAPIIVQLIATK